MGVTIQTVADRTAMTTRAVVKQAMKVEGSDTEYDGLVDRLIDAATEALQEYSGRIFSQQTYLEGIKGDDHPHLLVTHRPIVSVSQILLQNNIVTDYTIEDADSGILYRATGWTRSMWGQWDVELTAIPGTQTVTAYVTYDAGYLMPGDPDRNLPKRFEEACIRAVASWMRVDQRGGADVKRRKVGDLEIEYREVKDFAELALPPDARALVGQRTT